LYSVFLGDFFLVVLVAFSPNEFFFFFSWWFLFSSLVSFSLLDVFFLLY